MTYLENIYTKNAKRNKESLLAVLSAFNNPQNSLKIIHVAGTNGKGSSCAMLTSVLVAAGYTVGTFTSPHLTRYNERITIDNKEISDTELAHELTLVKDTATDVLGDSEQLSFFEIFTIAMYNHLNRKNVDFAVVEVGLGGRLDCTNVMESSILSVITHIHFDHTHILGETLEKIAFEKAGIIKKNCPVVLYSAKDEVYNVVKEIAEKNEAKLYYEDEVKTEIKHMSLDYTEFSASCSRFNYENVKIGLLGSYQVYNATHILLCVHALRESGVLISDEAMFKGLENAFWAGRMEVLSKKPYIIIDGAHNIDGIKSFADTAKIYFTHKKLIVVFGVSSDKDYTQMLKEISALEFVETIILTEASYSRALPAKAMKDIAAQLGKHIIVESNYKKAVDTAISLCGENDFVCVIGSLYLLGDVRPYVLDKK